MAKKTKAYVYGISPLRDDPEYKNISVVVRSEYEEAKEIYGQTKILFYLTVGATVLSGGATALSFLQGHPVNVSVLATAVGALGCGTLSVLDYKLLKKTKLKFETARNACEEEIQKRYNTSPTGFIGMEIQ